MQWAARRGRTEIHTTGTGGSKLKLKLLQGEGSQTGSREEGSYSSYCILPKKKCVGGASYGGLDSSLHGMFLNFLTEMSCLTVVVRG